MAGSGRADSGLASVAATSFGYFTVPPRLFSGATISRPRCWGMYTYWREQRKTRVVAWSIVRKARRRCLPWYGTWAFEHVDCRNPNTTNSRIPIRTSQSR
jgi:hypothetical protein